GYLPDSVEDQILLLQSDALSSQDLDYFIGCFHTLEFDVAVELAKVRSTVMTDSKRGLLSLAINFVIEGISTSLSTAQAHQVFWRLMSTAAARGTPMSALDLSKVDLTGRNVSGFNFSGSNLPVSSLNQIDFAFLHDPDGEG